MTPPSENRPADPLEPVFVINEADVLKRKKKRNDVLIVGLLLFTLGFFYLLPRMIILIHAGEAGVLFRRFNGGTVTDRVYGEGIHFLLPWNQMIPYTVRFQATNFNFTILAESGLTLYMDLTIRYRPMYDLVGVLHQKLGPNYAATIVIPEVKSALRSTVGDYTVEEIYTSQRSILDKVVGKAADVVAQRYIEIDDVVIERITLPDRIQHAIELKLEQKQEMEAYTYRIEREKRERERKIIEADGYDQANQLLTNSLTADILKWRGIEATRILATSTNSKVIVVGNTSQGLPVILGNP